MAKSAAQKAADKAAKDAKKGTVTTGATAPEVADEGAKLDAEIEKDTKAPAGVKTATGKEEAPVKGAPYEDEDGVRRIAPQGKFVSVGSEIFNEFGVLVGSEANSTDAARKTDRFNSLRKFR